MRWAALLVSLLWAASAAGQESPSSAAEAAARQLETAAQSLDAAKSARDRVRALTRTVRGYEAGLAAMRDGLRRAATREATLARRLDARRAEVEKLLGTLQVIETAPPPILILHPSGPMGAARSGMMLADVTPGLNARVAALRSDLEEVRTLRLLQQSAAARLEEGLSGVQNARAALSKAIADRTDLPRRFTEDPVRTAILISSTETLDGFASGLANIASNGDIAGTNVDVSAQKGAMDLPVRGVLLHRQGEADAAGVRRQGILVATRPRALVTTPVSATIRYHGPLLDMGNVVILEPQSDTLFVLAGLGDVYGQAGQVIPAGTPVGLMGDAGRENGGILSLSGDGSGTDRSETLYIEVRESGSPVDPETWFRTNEDG